MSSSSIPATQTFLVPAEQDALIALIQGARTWQAPEDSEAAALATVIIDTTAAQAAMEQLIGSYAKLIQKLAWRATTIEREDAESELKLAFIEAVHAHDLTRGVPFHATLPSILKGTLADAQARSDVIVVPETTARRYWKKMGAAGMDVQAAYASCADDDELAPETFLAVHHAISVQSFDVSAGEVDRSYSVSNGGSQNSSFHERFLGDSTPTAEENLVQVDLVRWLFTQVTDRQETICRVRYGFSDLATETFLVEFGFHLGDVLSDIQVAAVTGIGAKTVDRDRRAALKAMKAAYLAVLDQD